MKSILSIIFICLIFSFLYSCTKDGISPYNLPYFYIKNNERNHILISATRKDIIDYKVCLNAQYQKKPIDLKYEIKLGDGLQEGRDFKLITTSNILNFPEGIFERSISIAWLESNLTPNKDNTITIKLINNSNDFLMGLPGPDHLQRQLVITKY